MTKKIFLIIGLIIAAGAIYGLYEFNRTAEDLSSKSPDYSLTVTELSKEFESNEAAANEKYLGKLIQFEGTLLSKEAGENVILTLKGTDMTNVRAEMALNQEQDLKAGSFVKVKGICTGYLLDVVLTECVTID